MKTNEVFELKTESLDSINVLPQIGKDELNLAEFPIALLSESSPAGVRTLEFQDQIFDTGRKRLVKRRLTIEGSETYGLPTAKDDEVILALIQLSKRKGFNSRNLQFTRFELLHVLGWANTGQSYSRVTLALHRWVSVTLHYENAWWDKSEERWTSGAFHIIDDFEINDSREQSKQFTLLPSRINWNDRVFKSFLEGNLKNIRYDVYVKLKHPTAKRMYRFLDKRFHHAKTAEFGLKDFAHEHIGLSRTYKDCGKIKEKLQPAIDELEKIGFIEPMKRDDRYQKVSKGSWRITLTRKHDRNSASPEPVSSNTFPPLPSPLGLDLINRGVSPITAEELISSSDLALIRAKIEVFDWMMAKTDKRVSISPGGYLADSIRKNYAVPKGFQTRAQIDAEAQARDEARQHKLKEARLKQERLAREEQENEELKAAADVYLAGLTKDEREALEREFRIQGGHGSGKIFFEDVLLRSYVIQKLGLVRETELQT